MAKKEATKDSGLFAKNPALESALAQIQKQFGKEAIMKMGDGSQQNIEAISSGSLGLDIALGIGGYPKGRIVEIYGAYTFHFCIRKNYQKVLQCDNSFVLEL